MNGTHLGEKEYLYHSYIHLHHYNPYHSSANIKRLTPHSSYIPSNMNTYNSPSIPISVCNPPSQPALPHTRTTQTTNLITDCLFHASHPLGHFQLKFMPPIHHHLH
jgi:hypothetical protein